MANIFELNINLNSTEQTETEKALKKTTDPKSDEEVVDNKLLGALKLGAKVAGAVHVGQKLVSDVVMPMYNLSTTTIGTIYGDTARLNKIQNMASTVNTGLDFVKSGLSGYAAGTAISAKGGTAGAIISVVLDALGKTIEMVNRGREFDNKQFDNRYNAYYSQERLGLIAINKGR